MGIFLIIHISPIPIPKDDTVCGSVLRGGGREGKRREEKGGYEDELPVDRNQTR